MAHKRQAPSPIHGLTQDLGSIDMTIQDGFPFLLLPGEIRNKIYKYVLTTKHNLLFKVCTMADLIGDPEEKDPRKKVSLYMNKAKTQDEKEFQRQARKKMMAIKSPKMGIFVEKTLETEFNQLKYVNKQLYRETRNLEIQFNKLTFMHPKGLESGATCLSAMRALNPASSFWMKSVMILGTPAWWGAISTISERPEIFAQIAQICNANPKLNVRYMLPVYMSRHWTPLVNQARGVSAGVFCASALRGLDFWHIFPASTLLNDRRESSQAWRGGIDVEKFYAPNFSFILRPACTKEDMTWLSQNCFLAWKQPKSHPLVRQLMLWIKDGI